MGKTVSKKNLEKLRLYLEKNGIAPKPNNKKIQKPGPERNAENRAGEKGTIKGGLPCNIADHNKPPGHC